MINSTNDINTFICDKIFNKIFILCGKKSFVTSGAQKFFNNLLKKKEISYFYKKSDLYILFDSIIFGTCKYST